MPGERKPNFQRAAQEVLKRALGHSPQRNEEALHILLIHVILCSGTKTIENHTT